MIIKWYLSIFIGLVAVSIGYILFLITRNIKSRRFYRKKCPNIPFAPDDNLITGHNGLFLTQKYNCNTFDEYHKKLGKTYGLFRFDRFCVSTLDLDLWKQITLDEPNDHVNRPYYSFPLHEFELDSIASAKDKQWAKIRRSIAPALSAHKVKSVNVQAEIDQEISKLVKSIDWRLEKKWFSDNKSRSIDIDVDEVITRFSMSYVFTSLFKQPNRVFYSADNDYWCELMHKSLKGISAAHIGFVLNIPILHSFVGWLIWKVDPTRVIRKSVKKFIIDAGELYKKARIEAEHANKDNKEFDFTRIQEFTLKDGSKFKRSTLDHVIDRLYDGTLSRREYINSISFLFYAAERTTADVMSRILYNLAKHPAEQEKLRKLVLVEGVECEYINWIIKESIRLFPSVTLGCSRVVTRDFYTKDNQLIPKGTSVYSPVCTIHRMKEYWGEDADEFKPERWSDENNFHPCQFLGFGSGKRGCVGKELALVQLRKVISSLILRFKFEKSQKPDDPTKFSSPVLSFLITDQPIYVKVSSLS